MTLINHPGSYQQAALACLDSGTARDIALMLADAHAVLDGLACGDAPDAARRPPRSSTTPTASMTSGPRRRRRLRRRHAGPGRPGHARRHPGHHPRHLRIPGARRPGFLFISPPIRKGTEKEGSRHDPDRETPAPAAGTAECKRPGCGNLIPPGAGRGRHRVFCGDDCARRYHNDARLPVPARLGGGGDGGPLDALEQALRQAAVLARTARNQVAALDPARVRADIADAEAARRAEAAAVTAQARQAEAEAEAQALAEALQAARDDTAAARDDAQREQETARALSAELDQLRRDTAEQVNAAAKAAGEQVTAARDDTARFQRERDDALAAARDARTAAETETARARQAEADARDQARHARDDAAREREALRDGHNAQLEAQRALTDAERARAERAEAQLETERADRRQLTSHITSNGHEPPAAPARSGARSK